MFFINITDITVIIVVTVTITITITTIITASSSSLYHHPPPQAGGGTGLRQHYPTQGSPQTTAGSQTVLITKAKVGNKEINYQESDER